MIQTLLLLFVLMTCWRPSFTYHNNLTISDTAVDFSSITVEDDSERELSSQLEEVDIRSSGWSTWSPWSSCSRSCDGGISHQLRSCESGSCSGEHVRYKICNMQVVAFFACLAVANAGILTPAAKIVQAPSSHTTVVGSDGSAISSVRSGGQIIEGVSEVVAHPAPVVAAAPAIAAFSAPAVSTYAAPVTAYTAPAVAAYSAPSVVSSYGAPVVTAYSTPVVGAYSAPVVSAYSAPVVGAYSAYSAPVLSAYSAPVVASAGVVAHKSVDTVISGPSGTITTGNTVSAPAVFAA